MDDGWGVVDEGLDVHGWILPYDEEETGSVCWEIIGDF